MVKAYNSSWKWKVLENRENKSSLRVDPQVMSQKLAKITIDITHRLIPSKFKTKISVKKSLDVSRTSFSPKALKKKLLLTKKNITKTYSSLKQTSRTENTSRG
jgi:hypothetical protein